jgi:hypothetical protein
MHAAGFLLGPGPSFPGADPIGQPVIHGAEVQIDGPPGHVPAGMLDAAKGAFHQGE